MSATIFFMGNEDSKHKLEQIHRALIGDLEKPGGLIGEVTAMRKCLNDHIENTALYRRDLSGKMDVVATRVDVVEADMIVAKQESEKKKAYAKGKQIGLLAGASTAGAGLVKLLEGLWPKP